MQFCDCWRISQGQHWETDAKIFCFLVTHSLNAFEKDKLQKGEKWHSRSWDVYFVKVGFSLRWAPHGTSSKPRDKRIDCGSKSLFWFGRLDLCHYFPRLLIPVNISRSFRLLLFLFFRFFFAFSSFYHSCAPCGSRAHYCSTIDHLFFKTTNIFYKLKWFFVHVQNQNHFVVIYFW